MGFIQKLFSGGASELINALGNTLDKVITTKGEKMQLELELKKADQQYELDKANLALEEHKIVIGDTDSARKRDADVQASPNASTLSKNVPPILALGTTLLTFSLFGLLMFYDNVISQERRDITLYVLGVLSAILTQVFGFYFGSSQGSVDKNSTIRSLNESLLRDK